MVACLLLAALAAGCGTSVASSGDPTCRSHYEPVASASTWPALRQAMETSTQWGHVTSLRTQARGADVGAGDQRAVRVVDLLDEHGQRLAQADVWRTPSGGWAAGVWAQCID